MVTEPAFRYIVIRPAPDLPEGFLPPNMDGMWYDLDDIPPTLLPNINGAVSVATDKFERREYDGATARVYEVRV